MRMDVFFLASSTLVELDAISIVEVIVIGLVAGVIGGLLGVGGSIIIIPGLTLVLGYNQHLYQATAMIANVAVSIPAAWRHYKAKAAVPRVLKFMVPAALLAVLFGVWLSNLPVFQGPDGAVWLGRILALMMIYVIFLNVRKLLQPKVIVLPDESRSPDSDAENDDSPGQEVTDGDSTRITSPRSISVGSVMGVIAGLLGVGGGAIAVPLQQLLLRLPLKSCIANSAAVICVSATIGAIAKNVTLSSTIPDAPGAWQTSLIIAAILAPTCWIGGYIGAILTHRLSLRFVRIVFILLMIAAAIKMAKPQLSWFGMG